MTTQSKTGDYRLVVEISGIDLRGLLETFTKCIRDLRYNIDDINLSTGEGWHTTFLTCVPTDNKLLPRRALKELEDKLKQEVQDKYKKDWYEARKEADPDPADEGHVFTVKVRLPGDEIDPIDGSPDAEPICIYLGVTVHNAAGIVYNLSRYFSTEFNITNATISPLFASKEDAQALGPSNQNEIIRQFNRLRVLWLTLRYYGKSKDVNVVIEEIEERIDKFNKESEVPDYGLDMNKAAITSLYVVAGPEVMPTKSKHTYRDLRSLLTYTSAGPNQPIA